MQLRVEQFRDNHAEKVLSPTKRFVTFFIPNFLFPGLCFQKTAFLPGQLEWRNVLEYICIRKFN